MAERNNDIRTVPQEKQMLSRSAPRSGDNVVRLISVAARLRAANCTAQAATLVILCLAPALCWPQRQPAEATNPQVEQVNINKSINAEDADLTIFRTGDKAERNVYISQVVPLQHANPYEMLPHVLRAVTREKGTARGLATADPTTTGPLYFMQVITTAEQMPSVIETIQALDLPGMTSSEGDAKSHLRLRHRAASEVAAILRATTGTPEGRIGFDDVTNTLYVNDTPSDALRILRTAQFYDVPAPQVEFEFKAVEYDCDDGGTLGLYWDAFKQNLGGQLTFSGNLFERGPSGPASDFYRFDALLTIDASALANFVNYTTQNGCGKVITRATVTATNQFPGVISAGRRVPFETYTTVFADAKVVTERIPGVSAGGEDALTTAVMDRPVIIQPPSRSILNEANAPPEGINIAVLPNIGTDLVTADFTVLVNSVTGYTKLGAPIVSERLTRSTVTLRDCQTFCLGGFDKYTCYNDRRGIPGLQDVPGVSRLFSAENQVTRRSKIIVMVTPRIRNQVIFTDPMIEGSPPEIVEPPIPIGHEPLPPFISDALAHELPVAGPEVTFP